MVAHKEHAANSKVANAIMTKIFRDIFAVDPVIDINFSRLFNIFYRLVISLTLLSAEAGC